MMGRGHLLTFFFLFFSLSLVVPVSFGQSPPPAGSPAGSTGIRLDPRPSESWPESVSDKRGFAKLGKAIILEPGYPAKGSDVEKARHIMSRLPAIAQKYNLRAGSGGVFSQAAVGIARFVDNVMQALGRGDPENAATLKSAGVGNCGEWSWAFSEILTAAGVTNKVIYADNSSEKGASLAHTGTDTAVLVVDLDKDKRPVNRVFDPYQAAFYDPKKRQPTADSVALWTDLPMTDADQSPQDRKSIKAVWQKQVVKPFIKDAVTQDLLFESNDAELFKKGRIIGILLNESDSSPAGGVEVSIQGEKEATKLTTQRNGQFTTALEPGVYQIIVASLAGPVTAEVKLEEGAVERLTLKISPPAEESVFGRWSGWAKVIRSSEPKAVGVVEPYELEITPLGNSVQLKNPRVGVIGKPAGYKTSLEENHLAVQYSGEHVSIPGLPPAHIEYSLDVEVEGDRLSGKTATTSTASNAGATAVISLELALDLERKK